MVKLESVSLIEVMEKKEEAEEEHELIRNVTDVDVEEGWIRTGEDVMLS